MASILGSILPNLQESSTDGYILVMIYVSPIIIQNKVVSLVILFDIIGAYFIIITHALIIISNNICLYFELVINLGLVFIFINV